MQKVLRVCEPLHHGYVAVRGAWSCLGRRRRRVRGAWACGNKACGGASLAFYLSHVGGNGKTDGDVFASASVASVLSRYWSLHRQTTLQFSQSAALAHALCCMYTHRPARRCAARSRPPREPRRPAKRDRVDLRVSLSSILYCVHRHVHSRCMLVHRVSSRFNISTVYPHRVATIRRMQMHVGSITRADP